MPNPNLSSVLTQQIPPPRNHHYLHKSPKRTTVDNFDTIKSPNYITSTGIKQNGRLLSNAAANNICHGRVEDIEKLVSPQWWKSVFADSMYLKTDGDVVEDPEITREEIGLLEGDPELLQRFLRGNQSSPNSLDVQEPAKILDLCCGQGRHSLFLAKKYPHLKLYGHDQSDYLISLAKERAYTQQLSANTTFTVGDCRKIPYADNTFDIVLLMGNSFGYFTDEQGDQLVLKEVNRVLNDGGLLVLDLTDGGYMRRNFSPRSWEWIDNTCFVCRERQLSKDGLRLNSREVVTFTTKGVVRDQFYQERLYDRAELSILVKTTGFDVVQESKCAEEPVITSAKELSKRKEDLGMMEQRILLKAVKHPARESSSITLNGVEGIETITEVITNGYHPIANGLLTENPYADSPPFVNFVVILGDTSKPCIGKLNNTWNQEDFLTRQKFLDALYELYPRNVLKILDSHANLHHTLSENIPTFAFNLCDEGFDNDALKELHVPAILDMLGIPYSGAGPNCLAYCYDKGLVNRTASALGVPTPRETYFFANINTPAVQNIDRLHEIIETDIEYPAFIKPLKGDNSLGITTRSIVYDKEHLDSYMNELHGQGIFDVIVQEYLQGTEYTVGMVGNPETGFHFFPVLEVDYSNIVNKNLPPILGFESKWDPSSPYWNDIKFKKANLHPEVEESLRQCCIVLWERFGCRDYARFDFRCDIGRGDGYSDDKDQFTAAVENCKISVNGSESEKCINASIPPPCSKGKIKLLEVNPNPGWCWDGKLAYMAKLEGKGYTELICMILRAAWDRIYGNVPPQIAAFE